MNDKRKRRLAGAALLLVAAFVVVSLLPTPEQAAHQAGVEVVTIPLHDVISTTPQPTATTALPQTLAATDDTPAPVDSTAASHGDHDGDGTATQDLNSSGGDDAARSEEHTSELQSLMRTSYAVFCLKTKKRQQNSK